MRNAGTKFESVFSSKAIGEPPLTLAVSVVSALRSAINSYRADVGTLGDWTLEIPLTSERIRMCCQDPITDFVSKQIPTGTEDLVNILK